MEGALQLFSEVLIIAGAIFTIALTSLLSMLFCLASQTSTVPLEGASCGWEVWDFRGGIGKAVFFPAKCMLSYIPKDIFAQLGLVVVEEYCLILNALKKLLQI